jgi:hypothetical protein
MNGIVVPSKDGNSVSLVLEQGCYVIPLTVEGIDAVTLRTGILGS